jgi:pimeloyl-ACP methyl ester carboxylesterase
MTQVRLGSGVQIAYGDTGGSGVPLIFSHGLFMDRTMFAPQLAAFRPEWRVIVWDERAHGGTPWTEDFTYWDSARDLLALMDALGVERCIHVGMSQGGLLGMRAALLAPKRFYGIVQLSSQAGKLAEEGIGPFRALMDGWIKGGPTAEILRFLSALILGPGADQDYWHARWRAMPGAHIRSALSPLYALDELYDRLAELDVPVSVIHGLADASTPVERAVRVAEEVPNLLGVTLIEGGPHAVNLTHPTQVNAAISAFLERLTKDSPELAHGSA